MASRRDIIEGVLFIPAMLLLVAVIGGGMYAVIVFGGWALQAIYGLLRYELNLPHPVALAAAVILAALTVYAVVPRAISLIGARLNRRKSE